MDFQKSYYHIQENIFLWLFYYTVYCLHLAIVCRRKWFANNARFIILYVFISTKDIFPIFLYSI
jgi:hypothetical protein